MSVTDEGVALRVEDLHVAFGERKVLDGFDLEVRRGETLCLLGRSGAGKSVVLRNILGLSRPQRGSIWYDGVDIAAASEESLVTLRQRIGMVFQANALFDSLTVAENVAYGLRQLPPERALSEDEIAARVDECLRLVDLPDVQEQVPAQLSGGMKKRVAIARAVAPRPELLLYDEPTTGLDPATCRVVDDLIVSLADKLGVTSLLVTHDVRTVLVVADRIVILEAGKAAWTGSPAALAAEHPPPEIVAFLGAADRKELTWTNPAS